MAHGQIEAHLLLTDYSQYKMRAVISFSKTVQKCYFLNIYILGIF